MLSAAKGRMNATPRPSPLNVYKLMLVTLGEIRVLLPKIAKHDRDLADQLKRAASSVVLNLAESEGVSGGNRVLRRRTALGSLYEVRGALDVAVGLGYLDAAEAAKADELAYAVGGMLHGLVR